MTRAPNDAPPDLVPTPRTRVTRNPTRAHSDRKTVYGSLDAGLLCHLGYVIDGQP